MWLLNKKRECTFEIDKDIYARFCIICAQKNVNNVVEELMENYIKNSEKLLDNITIKSNAINSTKVQKTYIIKSRDCSEKEFEAYLRETPSCFVKVFLFHTNDKIEQKLWKVNNFTQDTKLNQNLASGYLRDWKTKGITAIKLEIE